jgi:hypothetical protein
MYVFMVYFLLFFVFDNNYRMLRHVKEVLYGQYFTTTTNIYICNGQNVMCTSQLDCDVPLAVGSLQTKR